MTTVSKSPTITNNNNSSAELERELAIWKAVAQRLCRGDGVAGRKKALRRYYLKVRDELYPEEAATKATKAATKRRIKSRIKSRIKKLNALADPKNNGTVNERAVAAAMAAKLEAVS
jgi:hypothetical protein